MKVFKLSLLFFTAALFIGACNRVQDEVYDEPNRIGRVEESVFEDDERFARENLDLQAVGALLERSNNAEEFENLLNSENGINNLDLNDDGYADYISVREFDDRDDNERGFSLFSMFGPELIQEIATIIFDRDGYDNGAYPGSRVLLRGNEYLYGDDYYYETNWLDRSVPIVNWVFTDRDDYYRSPYYYENYPSYYEPYEIVETPVYRTRIEQYYVSPVFIQTAQPTVREIRIVSPYRNKSLNKIEDKSAKQMREKFEFKKAEYRRNNPGPPDFVREKKENKNFSVKEDKRFRDNPNKFEKPDKPQQQMREKPDKQERVNLRPQNQVRFEQPKQPKQENRVQPNGNGNGKQNGGGNNPGGGGNKGGGGKGKGKP
jgi:hypothetical protein